MLSIFLAQNTFAFFGKNKEGNHEEYIAQKKAHIETVLGFCANKDFAGWQNYIAEKKEERFSKRKEKILERNSDLSDEEINKKLEKFGQKKPNILEIITEEKFPTFCELETLHSQMVSLKDEAKELKEELGLPDKKPKHKMKGRSRKNGQNNNGEQREWKGRRGGGQGPRGFMQNNDDYENLIQ